MQMKYKVQNHFSKSSFRVKTFTMIMILTLFQLTRTEAQGTYTTNKGHVSFFANAPVADVDARSDKAKIALNTSTGELTVNADMTSFQFQNKKMGRDARGSYIETDKFPQASFAGKITGKVDYDKPGSYPVTATGKLKVHGTEREVNEKGTVNVQKGRISIQSQFNVALKDHNIETPKILGQEMTEDQVIVKVEATLFPKSKK
jgi:polyisoprenoid-binding protein YceI